MSNWYVLTKKADRPVVVSAVGSDPDDALTDCQRRGNYFPSLGDRVIRLIEVNQYRRRAA